MINDLSLHGDVIIDARVGCDCGATKNTPERQFVVRLPLSRRQRTGSLQHPSEHLPTGLGQNEMEDDEVNQEQIIVWRGQDLCVYV